MKIFAAAMILLVLFNSHSFLMRMQYAPGWNREFQHLLFYFDLPVLIIYALLFIMTDRCIRAHGFSAYQKISLALGGVLTFIGVFLHMVRSLAYAEGAMQPPSAFIEILDYVIFSGLSSLGMLAYIFNDIINTIIQQGPAAFFIFNILLPVFFGGCSGLFFGILVRSKRDVLPVLLAFAGYIVYSGGFFSFREHIFLASGRSERGAFPDHELYYQYSSIAEQSLIMGILGLIIFVTSLILFHRMLKSYTGGKPKA
ncbi:MAG TPA: hypothetical protein HA257_09470 [Candidatus Methanoperedenaceae archaeon]|nr:hypothetical protein [Candidatus Methanoperedenaceae archaeon]